MLKKINKMACNISLIAGLVAVSTLPATADSFNLRVGSGQPLAPIEANFMAENYFMPRVTERVAAETEHKVSFTSLWTTVAGPADAFEAVEKGVLDIGVWCACFEPTKAGHLVFHYAAPFITDDPIAQTKITKQVFSEFPEWSATLADYNQTWLGTGSVSTYGVGTKFEWNEISDLEGKKIAGAGPNLPWIGASGAIPVQTTLNDAYTSLNSGIYEGMVMFPTGWNGFKLYETAKHYKLVGWGAMTIHHMSINNDTLAKLPEDVQAIIREEASNWMDETAGEASRRNEKALANMEANGTTITELPAEKRSEMAKALEPWVNERIAAFNEAGLPATAFFKRYLELAQEAGLELPHVYAIK